MRPERAGGPPRSLWGRAWSGGRAVGGGAERGPWREEEGRAVQGGGGKGLMEWGREQ